MSVQKVDKVYSLLQAIGDAINDPVENKFDNVLKIDTGFNKLLIIRQSDDANLVCETRVEKSVVVRCFVENVQFFVSTPKVPVPTPG
ncbi:hypothetical protein NQ318_015431 [Aromia moschata]|uniref:Uncharacterized protein n=1 Tax=Aromia moschata TaxID=1265417 RepID=A0AAV8YQY8_9CUCU|nr:hypothetical protein NQ318_015431 [Aromia moschata]